MSVYDKELVINGKAIRSPEQQVWKNMKDIEALQAKIKDAYKTSETLTSASVSVATADTNVGTAEEGWLMTEDGLLFKITGNDGDNVLLQFYSDLKGPQGETGPDGDPADLIDDNSSSLTKTWSSEKIRSFFVLARDKGIFATENEPETHNDQLRYIISDFLNPSGAIPAIDPKYNDLVMYINGDGNVEKLYQITAISGDGTYFIVEQIATFSLGKQLYQHNILITGTISGNPVVIVMSITNSSNTPFTKTTLLSWLNSNGFDGGGTNYAYPYYMATGYKGAAAFVMGVQVTTDDLANGRFRIKTINDGGNGAFSDGAVTDIPIEA